MQLQDFDRRDTSHNTRPVTEVLACKVLYVYDGRNAWYSTWVQRYRPDCFHTTLNSAQEFCERQRVQGSVFYIEELPALLIDSGTGALLVTQINCSNPLSDYSPDAIRSVPPEGKTLIADAKDNYLRVGGLMAHAALTFERDSRFWKKPPPAKNSLIMRWTPHINGRMIFADNHGRLFSTEWRPALLDEARLTGFTSQAVGSTYKLRWIPRASRAQCGGVADILRSARSANKASDVTET